MCKVDDLLLWCFGISNYIISIVGTITKSSNYYDYHEKKQEREFKILLRRNVMKTHRNMTKYNPKWTALVCDNKLSSSLDYDCHSITKWPIIVCREFKPQPQPIIMQAQMVWAQLIFFLVRPCSFWWNNSTSNKEYKILHSLGRRHNDIPDHFHKTCHNSIGQIPTILYRVFVTKT